MGTVTPINPHDRAADLLYVIDNLTGAAIEPGDDVHTATWSGTYTELLYKGMVKVTERNGTVGAYHPSQFNLTVTAMSRCGCSVSNGVRTRHADCRWP